MIWYIKLREFAAGQPLAELAGKVRVAVVGKFPLIPIGYTTLV